MSLPEPETQGHASAQGAGVALERDDPEGAIRHLAHGIAWIADMLVDQDERVQIIEDELKRAGS